MPKQVYIIALFTLLILYFTGCQKPQQNADDLSDSNYPESNPIEVTAAPGTKLYKLCPAGKVKEDSNKVDTKLFVFRSRVTLPGDCALKLQNSVFRPSGEDFQNAVAPVTQNSFLLSYKIDMENAPMMNCVPQYSVWEKKNESEDESTYREYYERLDVDDQSPAEILTLMGYPKPFPGYLVGIRRAICE